MRAVLIGLGQRALGDYVPALAALSEEVELVGVCDVDPAANQRFLAALKNYPSLPVPEYFTDRRHALDAQRPDLAIVATPHNTHLDIARDLLERKIAILKEKPFAISIEQAGELARVIETYDGHLRLCVQRRHHPLYIHARQSLASIGTLRHFDAAYQLNAEAYRQGWRAQSETSGGGAIIDMGYHLIDLLYWYFGMPSTVYATSAPKLIPTAEYDIEETVLANLTYPGGATGILRLSLCEARKDEWLAVSGSAGQILLTKKSLERYDRADVLVEQEKGEPDGASALNVLRSMIAELSNPDIVRQEVANGLGSTAIIDALYRSISTAVPVGPVRPKEYCA
ncbi:Gfo/Idh/MocA family protein [Actinoplanes sp. NPDC049599]|uniref:Gfo/Idh/MocA family protein n=1 Tax=Actinoplanes sp. NPDC049599 TaxID=3363903 RepID=UPI0037AC7E44